MLYGNILKIARFCTDDGPGIRTTVFLKGCTLTCKWCHNPESQNYKSDLFFNKMNCLLCKKCETMCKYNCHVFNNENHYIKRDNCNGCGACVKTCPTKSLELIGEKISIDEIISEIKKDVVFYQTSGGGVTVSGGEPLFQFEFTAELLRKCEEENIHTAIETSGFSNTKVFSQVIENCDFVMFDIKDTDEIRHKKNVGVSLVPILNNLDVLGKSGIPFVIRAPIIPNFNDYEDHFLSLKKLSKKWKNCKGVEIMPYHSLGNYKYELLDRVCACKFISEPSKEKICEWEKLVENISK